MGPILIFDKSTLESLNPDEAAWLDNFYSSNITPLFFVETLADLEKKYRAGRSPESVVGNLAYKTPDANVYINIHHRNLIYGELSGLSQVDMRFGRPIISGGKPTELEGKTGIVFQQSPEEEAFNRWQKGEFLDLERLIAKAWRQSLSNIDYDKAYTYFKKYIDNANKPKTLIEVKAQVDSILDGPDQLSVLQLGLNLIGISSRGQSEVVARWNKVRPHKIRDFAPYFYHVISVDLSFYLSMAADLISCKRPSHKIDMAYLYYLPFSMVFTSNDNLHLKFAPLFLREDQSFIKGDVLKRDLSKLDEHYSLLPEEIKNQGLYKFASNPPEDASFLVTQLWDRYLPKWREIMANPLPPLTKGKEKFVANEIDRYYKEGKPIDPSVSIDSDKIHHVIFTKKVKARKGKWRRFPPDVEQSAREGE